MGGRGVAGSQWPPGAARVVAMASGARHSSCGKQVAASGTQGKRGLVPLG